MRHEPNLRIEQYRLPRTPRDSPAGVNWGAFHVGPLRIISSGGIDGNPASAGWEHVSVSCATRCPTWDEMQKVKELFWQDEECVIQFHPPKSQYVNAHPYVLHLWRKPGHEPTTPPRELIG